MNNELERICKETVVTQWRHYPGILQVGQRKTMKNLRTSGMSRDSNRASPEYKSRALPLHRQAYFNTASAPNSEERQRRNVGVLYVSNEADHPRCLFPVLVLNKLNIFNYSISSQVLC
jgi:hypothetical protein